MSAENEESLTSQKQPSSENSSNPLVLEEDFETAPLGGLLEKPMDELTLDKLRARVIKIRQLRTPQVFKAEVEAETKATKDKPSAEKLKKQAEAFGDLL